MERPFLAWGSSGRGLGPAHHSAYRASLRGLPQEDSSAREEQEEEEREGEIERDVSHVTTNQRFIAVSEKGK